MSARTVDVDGVAPADPRQVLDELDDFEGKDRTVKRKVRDLRRGPRPDPATVRVEPMGAGRLTGHVVRCSEHGTLGPAVNEPVLIPKRSAARAAAKDHVLREHPEGARLVVEQG